MAIASSDIIYRASTTAGSAGNTQAQATAGNNLGKYVATTAITDGVDANLFPDMTGSENAALNVDYQCMFVLNNHATLTLQNAVVWISADVAGGATTAIGLDTTAISAVGSSSAQAVTIANKNTAPAGVTFSAPTTKGTGLSVGNLGPGQVKGIWIQRTATASAATSGDGASVRVEGDSNP